MGTSAPISGNKQSRGTASVRASPQIQPRASSIKQLEYSRFIEKISQRLTHGLNSTYRIGQRELRAYWRAYLGIDNRVLIRVHFRRKGAVLSFSYNCPHDNVPNIDAGNQMKDN